MKIEDLVTLLGNRLREFKLSRDYAKMSGNLERMNSADEEIISLEDTLYQLNLLVDVSKSAAAKEATLKVAITDGSISVLGEYDITSYATDPKHEEKIMNILSKMGVMDTAEQIDEYIKSKYRSSPVTGAMIIGAAGSYEVDTRLMMAIMEQDSSFGTAGLAVRTLNPGNVGNDDDGNIRTYESWQKGVTAVAEWLSRHRGSTIIPQVSEEPAPQVVDTSTSTPIIINTATSTPSIIDTSTSTPSSTSTSTPSTSTSTSTPIIINTATSTPSTNTATSSTSTSTPIIINTATSTSPIIDTPTSTSTPIIMETSTPETTETSTPPTIEASTPLATETTPAIN